MSCCKKFDGTNQLTAPGICRCPSQEPYSYDLIGLRYYLDDSFTKFELGALRMPQVNAPLLEGEHNSEYPVGSIMEMPAPVSNKYQTQTTGWPAPHLDLYLEQNLAQHGDTLPWDGFELPSFYTEGYTNTPVIGTVVPAKRKETPSGVEYTDPYYCLVTSADDYYQIQSLYKINLRTGDYVFKVPGYWVQTIPELAGNNLGPTGQTSSGINTLLDPRVKDFGFGETDWICVNNQTFDDLVQKFKGIWWLSMAGEDVADSEVLGIHNTYWYAIDESEFTPTDTADRNAFAAVCENDSPYCLIYNRILGRLYRAKWVGFLDPDFPTDFGRADGDYYGWGFFNEESINGTSGILEDIKLLHQFEPDTPAAFTSYKRVNGKDVFLIRDDKRYVYMGSFAANKYYDGRKVQDVEDYEKNAEGGYLRPYTIFMGEDDDIVYASDYLVRRVADSNCDGWFYSTLIRPAGRQVAAKGTVRISGNRGGYHIQGLFFDVYDNSILSELEKRQFYKYYGYWSSLQHAASNWGMNVFETPPLPPGYKEPYPLSETLVDPNFGPYTIRRYQAGFVNMLGEPTWKLYFTYDTTSWYFSSDGKTRSPCRQYIYRGTNPTLQTSYSATSLPPYNFRYDTDLDRDAGLPLTIPQTYTYLLFDDPDGDGGFSGSGEKLTPSFSPYNGFDWVQYFDNQAFWYNTRTQYVMTAVAMNDSTLQVLNSLLEE